MRHEDQLSFPLQAAYNFDQGLIDKPIVEVVLGLVEDQRMIGGSQDQR
jgi:hypothetical protein